MKNSASPHALQIPRRIAICRGIKWIAADDNIAEKIMSKVYERLPRNKAHPYPELDYQLAKLMRQKVPSVTMPVLKGRAKGLRIIYGNMLIVSTPPRLYSEWGYDFLKVDICVVGPLNKEEKIKTVFERQVAKAMKEKKRAAWYVRQVIPFLDVLFDTGLINGVIGRGSYFGKNGFPRADDDINFILFAKHSDKKTRAKILRVLKRLPKFEIVSVLREEKRLKKGIHPSFSFIIVSEDMAPMIRATNYEKYVLNDGVGISLSNLPKERSEALARKFVKLLPSPDKQ